MSCILLAAGPPEASLWWVAGGVGLIVGLIFLFVFFSFVGLWIQCLVTKANVGSIPSWSKQLKAVG